MAGPLGVGDQFGNLRNGCRAVHMEVEGHLLKGAWWASKVVFVRHAEGGANVNVGVFDRDFVYRRKLRQLGKQSKGGAREKVLEGSGRQVVAATLGGFVGFDLKPTDPPDHVHVLVDVRDCPLGQDRSLLSVCARSVVRLLHPVKIDSTGLVTHCAAPCSRL